MMPTHALHLGHWQDVGQAAQVPESYAERSESAVEIVSHIRLPTAAEYSARKGIAGKER
jgi:hypothetical protein